MTIPKVSSTTKWIIGGLLTLALFLVGGWSAYVNASLARCDARLDTVEAQTVTKKDLREFKSDIDKQFDTLREDLRLHYAATERTARER